MSPSSSSLQHLVAQLQNRYPMGSLTSELLTVHQGQYVVRATVQVGGVLLATGMAAAADIEQAEDRAKIRALETLIPQSISQTVSVAPSTLPQPQPEIPQTPGTPQGQSSGQSLSDRLAAVGLSLDTSGGMSKLAQVPGSTATLPDFPPPADPLPTPLPEPPLERTSPPVPAPMPETVIADWYSHINVDDDDPATPSATTSSFTQDDQPDLFTPPPIEPTLSLDIAERPQEPLAQSAPTTAPAPRNGKPRLKPEPPPIQEMPAKPSVDLSDVIAQTDVELARLGWSRTQGREHLKRTYGKRSRQELDEVELYDFLSYLEAQPAP
ncbi:MAG TPA: hypothetical protein V6C78_28115 [Crinalium sp.]